MIDDGWSRSSREHQTLEGLEADAEKFPHGLGHTVRVLKEKYGVNEVGVWQAAKGYWNGIEPGSSAEMRFQPYIRKYPNGELAVKAEETAAFGFWNTWHTELKKEGVDFVKVDGQSSMPLLLRGIGAYGKAVRALHTGLEASAALHFNGQMINCMGMAPEDIWNRPNSRYPETVMIILQQYPEVLENMFSRTVTIPFFTDAFTGEIGIWYGLFIRKQKKAFCSV